MTKSTIPFHAAIICFGLLALLPLRPAGLSGDLEAAPWTTVVEPFGQSLPGTAPYASIEDAPPNLFSGIAKLAEEGNPLAAVAMADYSRHELEDVEQTTRWLRMAVRNGDVDSAFALGELYYPVGGTLGREDFDLQPDVVLGYAWYAIALSGLKTIGERGGEARTDERRAREVVDGLRRLLLPSERVRAAEALSAWPEALPPDTTPKPMPGGKSGSGDDGEQRAAEPPGEDEVVELIRQWSAGVTTDGAGVMARFDSSAGIERVFRGAFARIREMAAAGDGEAEYMVAWCRFHGLGVEADRAAALPVIREKAEAGDSEAMFLMSMWFLEQKEKDRAADYARRAAEAGHGRSMMLLSGFRREAGDREQAAQWMEKAAEAGEAAAVEEMIGFAESSRSVEKLVLWLTVAMIRSSDPAKAYRCRMLVDFVSDGADDEALRRMLEAGERWHEAHPLPAPPPAG